MIRLIRKILFLFFLSFCASVSAQTKSNISVQVDKNTGEYTITSKLMNWNFSGSTNHGLTNVKTINGNDALGNFTEIKFDWDSGNAYQGAIKWYEKKPVVLFLLTLTNNRKKALEAFPSFTKFPSGMKEI